MSKRNSTQPTWMQKLLKNWAVLCVNNPYSVLTLCVLFSLAGLISAWFLWFPYSSPVSRLPKNFDERLVWEETSRQIQFNSEIMLRVSIAGSEPFSNFPEDNFSSEQTRIAEQRLDAAVALLKQKLSGNKKHFCDVISSRDLQVTRIRELYDLTEDDLRMLSAELFDARQVFDDGWALLESTNFTNRLTARFNPVQAEIAKIVLQQGTGQAFAASDRATQQSNTREVLAENRRLLVSASRFTEGLRQSLSQPLPGQSRELITPWQLNPDTWFAKANAPSKNSASNAKPSGETATVIIWVKLAEPQLANLLDRRVIGKSKKIDRKLVGKLNTSMTELFHIVETAGQEFDDVRIEPFGVPVDVYRGQTSPFPLQKAGLAVMFAVLTLLFVTGFGNMRLFLAVFVSTVCSFGTYLGFCALLFEMVTPSMLFIGISIPLFGVCTGVLQAAAFLNIRHKGRSVSEAIVEMMQISGKSVFSGGLMTVFVFLAGVFYLWFYPVEPTTATLSFRSSLVGINLTLFLLVQSVLACLIGQLAIFPALVQITQFNRRILTSPWQKMIEARGDLTPRQTLPTIPLPINLLLTFVLFAGFLYGVSRPHYTTGREEKYFVTMSEKQAARMPILVSRQWLMQSEFDDIPGLFACDASRRIAGNDAYRRAMIDNMFRNAGQMSVQQKIPLPERKALYQALAELHGQLSHHHSDLQGIAAFDKRKPLQEDLDLCQKTGASIAEACRLLTLLSEKVFYERVDAWQQAVASDLVVQQRSLQNRLYHDNRPETEIPPAIAKRFLDADKQPLVWLFPIDDWQTIVPNEQPQPVIDLFLARINEQKVQSGQSSSAAGTSAAACGGFPLLVLEGRQLMSVQLSIVGAVTLVALLLMIVIVHQSVQTGAMTVMTIIGGVSLYGLTILALGIPFGKITQFPIVFFPMMYPVFLDLFRHPGMSPDRFRVIIGGTIICLGVGIVVAGHLMFYADPALMTIGRTMTIGWAAFMLPMIVNLVGVARDENRGELRVASGETQKFTPHSTLHTPLFPQPASLATRDQLDFYRERIEAAGVFDQQQHEGRGTRDEGREVRGEEYGVDENNSKLQIGVQDAGLNFTPLIMLPEVAEQPKFPPVWSVGTNRRATQRIVVELVNETFPDQESIVSLPSQGARIIARKSGKIVVAAKIMQEPQDESSVSDTESPTILHIRQHDETAGQPVAGRNAPSPTPSHREYG